MDSVRYFAAIHDNPHLLIPLSLLYNITLLISYINHENEGYVICLLRNITKNHISAKRTLYQYLPESFCILFMSGQNNSYQQGLSEIRLSGHKLDIEVGRYINVLRYERKCTLCNKDDTEDGDYFICPNMSDLMLKY